MSSALPVGVSGILIITGTGTGVGKTVVTAAIAALAAAEGKRVAVLKPAQTGIGPIRRGWESRQSVRDINGGIGSSDGPASNIPGTAAPGTDVPGAGDVPGIDDVPDIDTVTRLSGVTDTHELARYPDPLSPEAAARISGLPPLNLQDAARYARKLAAGRDLVLVEGAGGLLVRYDGDGATIADLAARLGAPVLTVAAAGLGTLNHTALTLEALKARDIVSAGVVIGSWPRDPGLAERLNLADLETVSGGPLVGILPDRAGRLPRGEFLDAAKAGMAPGLGGYGPVIRSSLNDHGALR